MTFALYSVMFSFSLLIPIFVAMTAAAQIAGERQAGTLRMICMRPVSRVSLLLSKFLVVAFYTYLLMTFFIGLNLLVGLCFVGWGDLQLYPGALNLVDEPGKLMRDEALRRFAYASLSGTWALLVIAAIAMLFSVLCETPAIATVTTLALYVGFQIIGRVEFFEHLRPYFFTSDMDFWRDVFKPAISWQKICHYASVCGAYIFGALLVAIAIFDSKGHNKLGILSVLRVSVLSISVSKFTREAERRLGRNQSGTIHEITRITRNNSNHISCWFV